MCNSSRRCSCCAGPAARSRHAAAMRANRAAQRDAAAMAIRTRADAQRAAVLAEAVRGGGLSDAQVQAVQAAMEGVPATPEVQAAARLVAWAEAAAGAPPTLDADGAALGAAAAEAEGARLARARLDRGAVIRAVVRADRAGGLRMRQRTLADAAQVASRLPSVAATTDEARAALAAVLGTTRVRGVRDALARLQLEGGGWLIPADRAAALAALDGRARPAPEPGTVPVTAVASESEAASLTRLAATAAQAEARALAIRARGGSGWRAEAAAVLEAGRNAAAERAALVRAIGARVRGVA